MSASSYRVCSQSLWYPAGAFVDTSIEVQNPSYKPSDRHLMIQKLILPKIEASDDLEPDMSETLAQQMLANDRHYSCHFRNISCHHEDGVLTLRGRLPSFYLKQILQTILRDLSGIKRIDNQTDVCETSGAMEIDD